MVSNINEDESVSVNCFATGTPTPSYIWKFLSDIPGEFLLALAGGGGNSKNFGNLITNVNYQDGYLLSENYYTGLPLSG